MPYSIDRYNGTTIAVVEDGTIDNTLDIKLIGKNYAGYGEAQNENFVFLLENFCSPSEPPKKLNGQIWYDSGLRKLKFWDNNRWRTTGGAEIGDTPPAGLTTGDLWWDTANEQMFGWNGEEYILIGPQGVAGQGATQMRSRTLKDTLGGIHAVIEAIADGVSIFFISPEEFTIDDTINPVTGFSLIKAGVTLVYTPASGITTSEHRYWGTASNALKLEGHPADDFILKGNVVFETLVRFRDPGYTLGDGDDLAVYIENGTDPVIKNVLSEKIIFRTTEGGVTRTPLQLIGNDIIPGSTAISNIGSTNYKYNVVYATRLEGIATNADAVNVGGSYRTASVSASGNSIAARDASGDLTANLFKGTATSARYADLAEKYLTDKEYAVGTVVTVGGEKEVTAASAGDLAIGVISEKPAFMMNSELEGGQYVALKGRVPVVVVAEVNKGDRLIALSNGTATSLKWSSDPLLDSQFVFAIALETCYNTAERLIEAVIL